MYYPSVAAFPSEFGGTRRTPSAEVGRNSVD